MDENVFQSRVEEAISDLEDAFERLAEERDIDVEVQGGVLTVTFEEGEPGKFIVSPNSSAKQIWVSARVSSFKFDPTDEGFVLAGTGEPLREVMTRLVREQLEDETAAL
ncbi:MAG: iron donor protein CyaY [Blastocatellia bacterium AA13]|nr:MAG: iron donor protein CyaY [Blastocatellia bacterium AA13]